MANASATCHGASDGVRRRRRDVERADGGRGEPDGRVGQHPPDADARARVPARPSDGRLAQEERQHLPPRDAERAQHADLVAPGDDRDRHGVVDEKEPDDQRHPRQRREVEVKRREHPLDLLAAPPRPLRREPGRQS